MLGCMKTTLSLDEDVVAELRRIQVKTRRSFEQVANDLIRLGVDAYQNEQREARPVKQTREVRLGCPKIGDISNVHDVLSRH